MKLGSDDATYPRPVPGGMPPGDARITVLVGHTLGSTNPYLTLLADAVAAEGVSVRPFNWRALLHDEVDIWHMHWPEAIARKRPFRRAGTALLRLLAHLAIARVRRVAVIWTLHNARAHDAPWPWLDTLVRGVLVRGVQGWIALSDEAAEEAIAATPALRRRPFVVIPHGDYRSAYPHPPQRDLARRHHGVAADATLITFFGQIRPYKDVPSPIRAFHELDGDDWRLLIAGRVMDEDEETLRTVTGDDERVTLRLGHIDDAEVPGLFAASDLTVLPFKDILNSGSAILSLSFDTPVLVPARGSMHSLQRQVGSPWVQLYDGTLTAETIEEAARAARNVSGSAPLEALAWDRIGHDTAAMYEAFSRRMKARSQVSGVPR